MSGGRSGKSVNPLRRLVAGCARPLTQTHGFALKGVGDSASVQGLCEGSGGAFALGQRFAAIAENMGAIGIRVEKPGDLEGGH